MSDDNEIEFPDSDKLTPEDEILLEKNCKLSISVHIPEQYFTEMNYDTFLSYMKTVNEEVGKRLKEAAVDEWFKKQPLYNGE